MALCDWCKREMGPEPSGHARGVPYWRCVACVDEARRERQAVRSANEPEPLSSADTCACDSDELGFEKDGRPAHAANCAGFSVDAAALHQTLASQDLATCRAFIARRCLDEPYNHAHLRDFARIASALKATLTGPVDGRIGVKCDDWPDEYMVSVSPPATDKSIALAIIDAVEFLRTTARGPLNVVKVKTAESVPCGSFCPGASGIRCQLEANHEGLHRGRVPGTEHLPRQFWGDERRFLEDRDGISLAIAHAAPQTPDCAHQWFEQTCLSCIRERGMQLARGLEPKGGPAPS